MRIAILTNDYPPNARGGAGVVAEFQARSLEARGHEVKAFVCPPDFLDQPAPIRLLFHLADLGSRPSIVKEIVEWKPDVLVTHTLMSCGFATPMHVQRHGIRWVHVLHDVQLVEPSGQIVAGETFHLAHRVWRWAWSLLRRIFLGSPDAVVSPTEWLLKFHQSYGFFKKSETVVIPNPVGAQFIAPGSMGRSEGVMNHAPTVLFVGRLDPDKGIDVLVSAWRSMGEARPQLTIVGGGSRLEALMKLHDERLTVLGLQPHEQVLEQMRSSDVVVVPSLVWENQPNVILEALASGCRVVATDVGGIPETLGDAGWIVKPNNVASLVDGISSAFTDVDHSKREQTCREILARHRPDVVADALEGILKSKV